MAKKEQNSGFSEYKGFIKPLIKVVNAILLLTFLYLVYTPIDIEPNDIKLTAGDWVFLLASALLFIAAIIYYYSPKQLLFSLRGTSKILDNHPRGTYISFFVCIGIAVAIISLLIGFSSSLAKVLARLASPEEPLNIRNILLGFAGIIGIILAGWRSSVAERQTQAIEDRRKEERLEEERNAERREEERATKQQEEKRYAERREEERATKQQEEKRYAERREEEREAKRKEEERNAERRFDERFANAVKSLSQELNEISYPAHLGAITALRNLVIDNNGYAQQCLDILCSCNQWMEDYLEKFTCENLEGCYADRHLTEVARIAKHESRKNAAVTLHHERRSQAALQSIAFTLKNLGGK